MTIKLVNSKIIKIKANRNPDFSGKLKLSSNIHLNNIKEYKSELSSISAIKVEASFNVDYGELGLVEIVGELFFSCEKDLITQIISNFEEKKFNSDELVIIMNLTMQRFSLKAFDLEEELGLPIHIKFPSIQVKKE